MYAKEWRVMWVATYVLDLWQKDSSFFSCQNAHAHLFFAYLESNQAWTLSYGALQGYVAPSNIYHI